MRWIFALLCMLSFNAYAQPSYWQKTMLEKLSKEPTGTHMTALFTWGGFSGQGTGNFILFYSEDGKKGKTWTMSMADKKAEAKEQELTTTQIQTFLKGIEKFKDLKDYEAFIPDGVESEWVEAQNQEGKVIETRHVTMMQPQFSKAGARHAELIQYFRDFFK